MTKKFLRNRKTFENKRALKQAVDFAETAVKKDVIDIAPQFKVIFWQSAR